jgi:hypothetical protein
MTECSQECFEFEAHFSRRVTAQFDGGTLTTDGGALPLRETERRIRLLKRLPDCFADGRRLDRIEHHLDELLAQRIDGLALGYEDLNDHEPLRQDALLGALAGKSTLNRLELTPAGDTDNERYSKITYSAVAIDQLLVAVFQEAHRRAPRRIVLDLGATDTPLHGRQVCGDHLLRADSGFCRDGLMSGCAAHGVDYVFGFARNDWLRALIEAQIQQARAESEARARRRGSSGSSRMRRGTVGAERGGWWRRPSRSKARRTRAAW